MKAIIHLIDPPAENAELRTCPAPLWPLLDKPLFAQVAVRLSGAGIRDVLFVGGPELIDVQQRFERGAEFGLRLDYISWSRRDATDAMIRFAGDESVLLLPANCFVTDTDLIAAQSLVQDGVSGIRGIRHTRFRDYAEQISTTARQCERRYGPEAMDQTISGPADFYVAAPRRFSALAGALIEASQNARRFIPSTDGWYDMPATGLRIDSEQDYFELNRALLVQSLDGMGQPTARPAGSNGRGAVAGSAQLGDNVVLRGPVLVGNGATIEDDATLLGPCIIGPLSVVRRGATVIESVLWPGARVAAGSRVVHSLVAETTVRPVRRKPVLVVSPRFAPATRRPSWLSDRLARFVFGGRRSFATAKRFTDLCVSAVGTIVLAPVMGIAALAIKMESPGPILLKQRRLGRNGREFYLAGFRTTFAATGPDRGSPADRRPPLTRVGRLLRRTHLDRLPALWNVLVGEMSLVGPRPLPAREHRISPAWREVRLSVRPGITGLWQVCGSGNGQQGFDQQMYYDIEYVRSAGVVVDTWIAWRTLVVTGRGLVKSLLSPVTGPGAGTLAGPTALAERSALYQFVGPRAWPPYIKGLVPAVPPAWVRPGREVARRILLVAPQPTFEARGTPMNVQHMCRALTELGLEVHLATYAYGQDISIPGMVYHRTWRLPFVRTVPIGFSTRKILLDAMLAVKVGTLLLRHRFAAVHAIEESAFFSAPAARLMKTPFVVDLDSDVCDQLAQSRRVGARLLAYLARPLQKMAVRWSTCAVTVCPALTDVALRLNPHQEVFQIEDIPAPSASRPAEPQRVEMLRKQLKLGLRRVILYTGNLEPYQGVELLLDAMPAVLRRHPDAVAVVVGGEGFQIRRLRRRGESLGLGDALVLVGKQPETAMPEFMHLADVLVSPRRLGENTPLKIFTYMQSGRPIVATDLPTHRQVLDQQTAFLTPPTPEGLAKGLIQALADPAAAAEVGRRARQRVEREHSYEGFREKLGAVYEFVTEDKMPPPQQEPSQLVST